MSAGSSGNQTLTLLVIDAEAKSVGELKRGSEMRMYILSLLVLVSLLASACGAAVGGIEVPLVPRPHADEIGGLSALIDALRGAGLKVEPRGELDQPFFSVPGRVLIVEGEEIQVFAYPSLEDRRRDSGQISADGSAIGTTMVHWIAPAHFWAKGEVIVLYLGEEGRLLAALSEILGEELTQASRPVGDPPAALLKAKWQVADRLGLDPQAIELLSFEREDWPDVCLGMGGVGEMCAQVITPGWRMRLALEGGEMEVRSDLAGDRIRW
jgi:hypothetical protein